MPIYEFRCAKCQTKFEKLVSISSSDVPACPSCGSEDTKKLFSSFGFSSAGGKTSLGGGCSSCSSTNCSTCGK